MIISNTSPLIYLAKINKLDLLRDLFKEITIPKQVFNEAMIEKETYLDSNNIKKAVDNNWIKIKDIKLTDIDKESYGGIGLGEIAVISLSKKLKPKLLLIDDASARIIAESLGFKVKGTLYILLEAYRKNILNKKEVKDSVNKLISSGFRISQELYIQFLEELDKY